MSSFVQKAAPFFEHIVIGVAFGAMGYIFFWTFNTSFIGILGMVAVCFGGLKILIGLIIYGAWLFAVLFRPEYLKRREQEEIEKEAKEKQARSEKPAPFFAKYWGLIAELSLLAIGFLIIVITKN